MTGQPDGFGQKYVSALDTYLRLRNEPALNCAYELGREAVASGMGVLDMAVLHQAAVSILAASTAPGQQLQITETATSFFTEVLSPFEMSFRGYRAANEELRRLNESLQQQKEAVELANQEMESFSYSVSHDLRAPLRSVEAFSQIVLEECGPALDDAGRRNVQRIRDAAQRMAKLIDDLLFLARVTRGDLQRVDVNLTALARRIAEGLRATSPERDVELVIDDHIHGQGDSTLLGVVLENLLGNAWKFTGKRAHAEIRFGCEQRDGHPTYFVRDNGAGFDTTLAQKLFAPFQRFHAASEFAGTGIGLATVRRVVQRHDGEVWADATLDRGATFYFTFGSERR